MGPICRPPLIPSKPYCWEVRRFQGGPNSAFMKSRDERLSDSCTSGSNIYIYISIYWNIYIYPIYIYIDIYISNIYSKKQTLSILSQVGRQQILFVSLLCNNMHNNSKRWLTNYLSGRKAHVNINNTPSMIQLFRDGIPQGSVLSPTLII